MTEHLPGRIGNLSFINGKNSLTAPCVQLYILLEESGASGNLKGMCDPRKDKINCHRGMALEGFPGVHRDDSS